MYLALLWPLVRLMSRLEHKHLAARLRCSGPDASAASAEEFEPITRPQRPKYCEIYYEATAKPGTSQ